MSDSGDRDQFPFVLVLLLGFGLVLLLYLGPDLFARGPAPRPAAGWDPFSPVVDGLSSFGRSIGDLFSGFLH